MYTTFIPVYNREQFSNTDDIPITKIIKDAKDLDGKVFTFLH